MFLYSLRSQLGEFFPGFGEVSLDRGHLRVCAGERSFQVVVEEELFAGVESFVQFGMSRFGRVFDVVRPPFPIRFGFLLELFPVFAPLVQQLLVFVYVVFDGFYSGIVRRVRA